MSSNATSPPVSARERFRQAMQGRPAQFFWILVITGVIGTATYFAVMGEHDGYLSSSLDGCYDKAGNIYTLLKSDQAVDSQGSQCKAVLSLASAFGFNPPSSCSPITTITNPSDSTSFITAKFCNTNTVYSIVVDNPPTPLAQVPSSFADLINLAVAGFHNAFYGSQILSPLFTTIQAPRYFQVLNMTGSATLATDPRRVLNGTIPELPPIFAKATGFYAMGFSNNNLTGSLPANMGDSLLHLNVSNNPLLSG